MDVLERIQAWYKAQAERGRDPALGVRVQTLSEKPGWSVQIDLAGTPLSGLKLAPYLRRQYGSAYPALQAIKGALDPAGIMNPGKWL